MICSLELYKKGAIRMDCLGCRISNGMEPDVNIIFENELITMPERRGV